MLDRQIYQNLLNIVKRREIKVDIKKTHLMSSGSQGHNAVTLNRLNFFQ